MHDLSAKQNPHSPTKDTSIPDTEPNWYLTIPKCSCYDPPQFFSSIPIAPVTTPPPAPPAPPAAQPIPVQPVAPP